MRGSPLIRATLVLLALLALLVPLQILTGRPDGKPAPVAKAAQGAIAKKKFRLELTSTTVPFKFQITSDGKKIWESESNSTTITKDIELRFPTEGIDLVIDASWTGEKETAVRLALIPEGADVMAKTVWGKTSVSEVLTFKEEK